jgi:hypothetical protein
LRRQANGKTSFDAAVADVYTGALQNFLRRGVDLDQPAFARAASCLQPPAVAVELAGEIGAEGVAAAGIGVGVRWVAGLILRYFDPQSARCGEGIALHVVYIEAEVRELIAAAQFFIDFVASAVDGD